MPLVNVRGQTYDILARRLTKTVMAHCAHSTDEEISLMKQAGTLYCPLSNMFLFIRNRTYKRYLDEGLNYRRWPAEQIFHVQSYFRCRRCLCGSELAPLTIQEAFYSII